VIRFFVVSSDCAQILKCFRHNPLATSKLLIDKSVLTEETLVTVLS